MAKCPRCRPHRGRARCRYRARTGRTRRLLRLGVRPSAVRFGILRCTLARMPVPRLDGTGRVAVLGARRTRCRRWTYLQSCVQPVEDGVEHEALAHGDAELVFLAEPDDVRCRRLVAAAAVGQSEAMPVALRKGSAAMSLNITCASTSPWYFSAVMRFGLASSPVTSFQFRGVMLHTAPPYWVTDEQVEGREHGLLEVDAVGLGHGAREREGREVAAHAHAHREGIREAQLLHASRSLAGSSSTPSRDQFVADLVAVRILVVVVAHQVCVGGWWVGGGVGMKDERR